MSWTNDRVFFVALFYLRLDKQATCADVVVGLEERIDVTSTHDEASERRDPSPLSSQMALKADIQMFAAEGGATKFENDTHRLGVPDRVASNILNQHPIEVLAIEDRLQPHDKGRPRYTAYGFQTEWQAIS